MADDKKKTKQRIKPKWDINPYLFLLWLFRKTEDDVINEVLRGYTLGYSASSEVVAMSNVQSVLQAMTDDCFKAVPKMIEKTFLKELGTGATVEALTGSQNVIIETLSDSLLGNITGTVATTQETARTLYNIARLDDDIFRQAILENPRYNALMGNVPIYSAKEMEGYLRSHGVTGFVDKAGRKWSLSNYCDMAARTQNQIATNAAILSKDEHDLYKILAIGSTCDICAPLEGRVYSKSGTNPYYPPLASAFGKIDPAGSDDLSNTWLNIHPNCLVPGGTVTAEGVMAESRRLYSGKIITFETSTGNKISVTPNHPILTNRGFVPAGRLKKGDKIIEATVKYSSFFRQAPNNINIHATVNEELHAVMQSIGGFACCVEGSSEQFHNDGIANSKINIVFTNGLRKCKRNIGLVKKITEKKLPSGHFGWFNFFADSTFAKIIIRTLHSLYSFMCRLGFVGIIKAVSVNNKQFADLGLRATAYFGDFRKAFALIVKLKKAVKLFLMRLFESFRNFIKVPVTFVSLFNLLIRGCLTKSFVTHVKTSEYNGYVYNFETKHGYYAYNNIITHNCLHQLAKYTEGGKSEKQIQKMREFSSFESNPITNDPRTKKQIEAYRTKERNRAKLLRELRKKAVKNAME